MVLLFRELDFKANIRDTWISVQTRKMTNLLQEFCLKFFSEIYILEENKRKTVRVSPMIQSIYAQSHPPMCFFINLLAIRGKGHLHELCKVWKFVNCRHEGALFHVSSGSVDRLAALQFENHWFMRTKTGLRCISRLCGGVSWSDVFQVTDLTSRWGLDEL